MSGSLVPDSLADEIMEPSDTLEAKLKQDLATIDTASNPDLRLEDIPWPAIEASARELANVLRSKDSADHHTTLGQGSLPKNLAALLSKAYDGKVPGDQAKLASFELLRISANLCMDHDVNRQRCIDVGLLNIIQSILNQYTTVSEPTIDDLKVAKTAVGALLNSCFGFEPSRKALIALGTPDTAIQLSLSLYPPAKWVTIQEDSTSLDILITSYQLRIGLTDWTWRLVSAIAEGVETSPVSIKSLPFLVSALSGFISPVEAKSRLVEHAESRNALITADLETLEECVTLIEALSLDSEPARLAFGKPSSTPTADKQTLLSTLLDFIEHADYPVYWSLDGEEELKKREKAFDLCKAGSIKALVSIAGEGDAMDALWESPDKVVNRMVSWINIQGRNKVHRDDLVIAGCLTLGNIARKDAYCEALLGEPYNLASSLVKLLEPDADIKVKHAVTGLLKNLAQAANNRKALGESGILEKLALSKVWDQSCDMAETVQVSAIGVAKHLCNGDVSNTLRLMNSSEPNGVDQILALVKRSDSIIVKSEGTRVVAYCVRSLWRKDAPGIDVGSSPLRTEDIAQRRQQAANDLSKEPAVRALVDLLVTGQKHAILLNESCFALNLIAGNSSGATVISNALASPVEFIQSNPLSGEAPTTTTMTGTEALKAIISNTSGKCAPELRANACSLVWTLLRNTGQNKQIKEEVGTAFKDALKEVLDTKYAPEKLTQAAKWAYDAI